MTGITEWEELKSVIETKVADVRLGLEAAYQQAAQTFAEREAKVQSHLLVLVLKRVQSEMSLNHAAAQNQLDFCARMLATHDALVRANAAEFIEQMTPGATHLDQTLAALAGLSIQEMTTDIGLTTAKIASEALCLSSILVGFLGHREALAFEAGAQQELLGSLGDPGSGVLMLLKRLYAVGTRTLRSDQDADQLLRSLENFEWLMLRWRQLCTDLSQDIPLDQALMQIFEDMPG